MSQVLQGLEEQEGIQYLAVLLQPYGFKVVVNLSKTCTSQAGGERCSLCAPVNKPRFYRYLWIKERVALSYSKKDAEKNYME